MADTIKYSIAVIGGYGFLGTHICDSLFQQTMYKNIYIIGRNKLEHFEFVNGSFVNRGTINKDLSVIFSAITVVVYLAWNSTPFSSINNNNDEDNLSSLKKYLDFLILSDIQRFIFISSAGALYKSYNSVVFDEKAKCSSGSPYAVEKLMAEKLITRMLSEKCSVYILRPSNIFGPGQYFKQGMGLIPKLFDCARDEESIRLYEPLESERDYLFISDFVSALELFLSESYKLGIYNLSYGSNVSLSDLIEKIEMLVRKKINTVLEVKNQGNHSIISANKFQNITQWRPKVSFSEGLLLTKAKEEQ